MFFFVMGRLLPINDQLPRMTANINDVAISAEYSALGTYELPSDFG
jgi:hypothetical protein